MQAAEPRLIMPVDIDTGEACYVPVKLTLKPTQYYERFTYMSCAPSILPELDLLEQVGLAFNLFSGDSCFETIICVRGESLGSVVKFLFIHGHVRTIPQIPPLSSSILGIST